MHATSTLDESAPLTHFVSDGSSSNSSYGTSEFNITKIEQVARIQLERIAEATMTIDLACAKKTDWATGGIAALTEGALTFELLFKNKSLENNPIRILYLALGPIASAALNGGAGKKIRKTFKEIYYLCTCVGFNRRKAILAAITFISTIVATTGGVGAASLVFAKFNRTYGFGWAVFGSICKLLTRIFAGSVFLTYTGNRLLKQLTQIIPLHLVCEKRRSHLLANFDKIFGKSEYFIKHYEFSETNDTLQDLLLEFNATYGSIHIDNNYAGLMSITISILRTVLENIDLTDPDRQQCQENCKNLIKWLYNILRLLPLGYTLYLMGTLYLHVGQDSLQNANEDFFEPNLNIDMSNTTIDTIASGYTAQQSAMYAISTDNFFNMLESIGSAFMENGCAAASQLFWAMLSAFVGIFPSQQADTLADEHVPADSWSVSGDFGVEAVTIQVLSHTFAVRELIDSIQQSRREKNLIKLIEKSTNTLLDTTTPSDLEAPSGPPLTDEREDAEQVDALLFSQDSTPGDEEYNEHTVELARLRFLKFMHAIPDRLATLSTDTLDIFNNQITGARSSASSISSEEEFIQQLETLS